MTSETNASPKKSRGKDRKGNSVVVSDAAIERLQRFLAMGPGLTHPGAAADVLAVGTTDEEFRTLVLRTWKGGASPGSSAAPAPQPRPGQQRS